MLGRPAAGLIFVWQLPGRPLPPSLRSGTLPHFVREGREWRSWPLPRSGGGAFERMLGRGGGFSYSAIW